MAYRIVWHIPGQEQETRRVEATEDTRYLTCEAAEIAAAIQYDIESENVDGTLDYRVEAAS